MQADVSVYNSIQILKSRARSHSDNGEGASLLVLVEVDLHHTTLVLEECQILVSVAAHIFDET